MASTAVTNSDELRKRAREEDGTTNQTAAPTEQPALPIACVACSSSDVKYRCPRCERTTCSLTCCLAHKTTFACDGKRDRTKYVPLKQFSDSDLSSDFFFLEEVARSASSATRTRTQLSNSAADATHPSANNKSHKKRKVTKASAKSKHATKAINPHVTSDWLLRFPVPWQRLVQSAATRGVALTLLAPGMSKRERNTSYIDAKPTRKSIDHPSADPQSLHWRVEWSFPRASASAAASGALSLVETAASEEQTLFALLAQYLDKSPENAGVRGKLRSYATVDWRDRVLLLLRKEFTPASTPQFYRLDGNATLAQSFKRKAIVEFPVVIVALQDDASQYPVAHDRIEVVRATAAKKKEEDEDDDDGSDSDASQSSKHGDSDKSDSNDAANKGESNQEEDASDTQRTNDASMPAADTLEAFLDDESSVDDLLPSIAEADDELRMFGDDVDGIAFLGKPTPTVTLVTAA